MQFWGGRCHSIPLGSVKVLSLDFYSEITVRGTLGKKSVSGIVLRLSACNQVRKPISYISNYAIFNNMNYIEK